MGEVGGYPHHGKKPWLGFLNPSLIREKWTRCLSISSAIQELRPNQFWSRKTILNQLGQKTGVWNHFHREWDFKNVPIQMRRFCVGEDAVIKKIMLLMIKTMLLMIKNHTFYYDKESYFWWSTIFESGFSFSAAALYGANHWSTKQLLILSTISK